MILWTEAFSTGSLILDQQHRLLIENINALAGQLHLNNPTRADVEFSVNLVDFLAEYAELHFKAEEECMEEYRCPVHAQNQEAHQQFLEFIRDYRRQLEIHGFSVERLRALHHLMETWIREHILKIDTQLRPCMGPSA